MALRIWLDRHREEQQQGDDMTKQNPKALKIHPICDMVPKMSAEAFDALKADIEKNGQIDPIWVKAGEIIDGRHRYRACRELGIECKTHEYEGSDIETFVISVNVSRRHLSSIQKAWFIKRILALHPEHSNRAIAVVVGVDDKTVGAVRRRSSSAEFPHLTKRVGIDGRARSVTTKKTHSAPTHPSASLITKIDFEAKRVVRWLHDLHPNEVTDSSLFISQLQDAVDRLRSLSKPINVAQGEH